MARPKKVTEKPRAVMGFRPTTAEEEETIQAKVRESGLSQSEYLRRMALRGQVKVEKRESPDFSFETVQELNRIGVNLNQLTRLAHTTGEVPPEVTELCSQIEKLIAEAVEPR